MIKIKKPRTKSLFSEAVIQQHVVHYLHNLENLTRQFTFCHVPNGAHMNIRHAVFMKRQGMRAGEPDLHLYFNSGKLVLMELKAARGKLSTVQTQRMDDFKRLGFEYHVIKAETPGHAIEQVEHILKQNGVVR